MDTAELSGGFELPRAAKLDLRLHTHFFMLRFVFTCIFLRVSVVSACEPHALLEPLRVCSVRLTCAGKPRGTFGTPSRTRISHVA